jgi:hypothetical protein
MNKQTSKLFQATVTEETSTADKKAAFIHAIIKNGLKFAMFCQAEGRRSCDPSLPNFAHL